ncbi:MAG TPA: beta-N-acetylhexosaminidase [Devosiaceae bacterium]|jgi:hexosaminidase|nr:beta-N-acetylhexosaminidase [Devosiaceae bacterium]
MAAETRQGYLLESLWKPGDGTGGTYGLTLGNHTRQVLRDFRLVVSGPLRIADGAAVTGGFVSTTLSNHCELAPEAGLVLQPGGSWRIEIEALEWPLHHWTEGTSGAYVIHADGASTPAFTLPTRLAGSSEPLRLGTMSLVGAVEQGALSVIPWPRQVDVSGRRTPPAGLAIEAADADAAAAVDGFGVLSRLLFPGEGLVRQAAEGGLPVRCSTDRGLASENYVIEFQRDGVTVSGAQDGLFHGLVTLGQILRGARLRPHQLAFPTTGRIADAPVHGFRGCHLDAARRFYGPDEIRRFLAILAWNKLNVFHWHLSDDEAWRVEIDGYPELVRTGAWRGHGLPVPPLLGSGPEPEGGSYSKHAIRSIVGLATDLGIEVVPEIDVPGHCYALLKALPQLRDPAETGTYRSIQGFPNNCLNPAVEATYPILESIFGELFELFPSPRFHLGADEVPEDAWRGSPLAQDLLRTLGGGGAERLQAHFLSRLHAFLAANGRTAGAWEEAAAGGGIGRSRSYLVGWRTAAAARDLAAAGYQVVMAPAQAYYLDMAASADWWECGAGWAGFSSPQTTYEFQPGQGWSDGERANLLGIQACIWSEPMSRPAVFDRLVFPRLSAIAETAWSTPENRDYRRFAGLAGLMPNLYGQYEELLR